MSTKFVLLKVIDAEYMIDIAITSKALERLNWLGALCRACCGLGA
jgi:hypothetical protein